MTGETGNEEVGRICGACGYPLDHDVGIDLWFHARSLTDDSYAHTPLPLLRSEASVIKQRCDFCDRERIVTDLVLSESFDMPNGISRSIGHWASCEQCAEHIRRGRWGTLVTFVKNHGDQRVRSVPRKYYIALYDVLARNMFGVISLAEWQKRTDSSD